MARRNPNPRRRGTFGAVGVTVSACVTAGIFLFAGSAPADQGHSGPEDRSHVVICESSTVSHGGIDTSSAIVVRAPEGTPLLPGCRDG
jgi:hypothetical protein